MNLAERNPIKRSKELVTLSREHHDGLLLCWKINSSLNKGIPLSRISPYIIYFFDNSLKMHFEEEEHFVFSLLKPDNIYRKDAEMQHKLLREMIENIRNSYLLSAGSLKYFAETLNNHIRYEERVLFNIIENETDKTALKSLENKLTSHSKCDSGWEDQFWLS